MPNSGRGGFGNPEYFHSQPRFYGSNGSTSRWQGSQRAKRLESNRRTTNFSDSTQDPSIDQERCVVNKNVDMALRLDQRPDEGVRLRRVPRFHRKPNRCQLESRVSLDCAIAQTITFAMTAPCGTKIKRCSITRVCVRIPTLGSV